MDNGADGQWMTYAELGAQRGISKESALKLALRRKWHKQTDNRGHVRVCVPLEWATVRDIGAAPSTPSRVDISADIARIASAFETAITALREQFAAKVEEAIILQDRITNANAQTEAEREARVAAEAIAAAHTQRAEEADARAQVAEAAQQEIQADRDRLAAELAERDKAQAERQAQGLLARLMAAIRRDAGERPADS